MYIKEISETQLNDFIKTYSDSTLYQTSEYASSMANQGFETILVGLFKEDEIIGASVILVEKTLGFKYAYAPRGFMIDYTNEHVVKAFTKEIKKFLASQDIMAIKINPPITRSIYDYQRKEKSHNLNYDDIFELLNKLDYYHLGYNDMFESLKPRFESILDINIPYDEVFLNFKKELKTKIKNAEEAGIKIYKSNASNLEYLYLQTKDKYPRDLEYFKDMYANFDEHKEIDFYYAKLNTHEYLNNIKKMYTEYEQLSYDMNQKIASGMKNRGKLVSRKIEIDKKLYNCKQELAKATKISVDKPDGIILASALIIKHKDNVHVIIDGYDEAYKQFNAKHLLIWRLIETYHKQGFKTFNLGGMTNVEDKSKYTGLNEFKLGFRPLIYEYAGDFELITNSTLYFMYRHAGPITSILKK